MKAVWAVGICAVFLLLGASQSHGQRVALQKPIDTWENIHTFVVNDEFVTDSQLSQHKYDFIWAANNFTHQPGQKQVPDDMLVSFYIPYDRDPNAQWLDITGACHTLDWYQKNHPDWVVFQCDQAGQPGQPPTPADEFNQVCGPKCRFGKKLSLWNRL
jgi:hypothetical protein